MELTERQGTRSGWLAVFVVQVHNGNGRNHFVKYPGDVLDTLAEMVYVLKGGVYNAFLNVSIACTVAVVESIAAGLHVFTLRPRGIARALKMKDVV